MDPKEYEAEDFLQDPSFCDFCLGNNEQAVNFWKDWISLNPERAKVLQQARELYGLLNGNLSNARYVEDRQFFIEKMNAHLSLSGYNEPDALYQPTQRSPLRKLGLYAAAIAAAILLFVVLSPLFKTILPTPPAVSPYGYAEDSKAGERKSFQLADGTKVMLNAGSTIKVAKNFNVSTREILLEGEAFFDVTHNAQKPFIIHTASMDVKVLGTAFNIKAYPSDKTTETSLLKGSIEVTVKNDPGKVVILHPNEKIILPNTIQENVSITTPRKAPVSPIVKERYKISGLTYSSMDSSLVEVSWTDNKLAFDSDPFEDIATRLERWYNVSIRFENPDIRQYRFTGVFDKKTINQVLDALQLSRRFEYAEYEKDGKDQIIIK
jgi:ferric-dicitrate binding protein FerR (iron transport regulator)